MFRKVFLDHPRSVDETYLEHLFQATRFSMKMVYGGFACFVHGLIPSLCERTGSAAITDLHDIMVKNRSGQTPARKNKIQEKAKQAA